MGKPLEPTFLVYVLEDANEAYTFKNGYEGYVVDVTAPAPVVAVLDEMNGNSFDGMVCQAENCAASPAAVGWRVREDDDFGRPAGTMWYYTSVVYEPHRNEAWAICEDCTASLDKGVQR